MCGGGVTNTSYDGMLTSLGIVRTQIHCLGQGSVADKPRTSQCPSMSVADITDCATSPADYATSPPDCATSPTFISVTNKGWKTADSVCTVLTV